MIKVLSLLSNLFFNTVGRLQLGLVFVVFQGRPGPHCQRLRCRFMKRVRVIVCEVMDHDKTDRINHELVQAREDWVWCTWLHERE